MTRSAAAIACALILLALAGGPARAQNVGDPEPPEDPTAAEAQMRYRHGRELYQEGRYDEAVTELERALALDPNQPVLLYNLSLVHEKLDHFDEAIGYMRRYLDSGVEGEERARVEAAIRRLEGARQHAVPPPPRVVQVPVPLPPPHPPAPPPFGRADALFFVTAGVAAVALATTAVTGAMALSEETEVDRFYVGEDGTLSDRRAHELNANDLALASDVALVTTGVAALTATLLYALRRGESVSRNPGPSPAAEVAPDARRRDDEYLAVFGGAATPQTGSDRPRGDGRDSCSRSEPDSQETGPVPAVGWTPGGATATVRGRF